MDQKGIRNTYLDLRYKYELLLAELKKQQLLVSLIRLFVFVAGGIISAIIFGHSITGGITAILITIIIFLYLVKKYEDYSDKITITGNLIRINDNEINATEDRTLMILNMILQAISIYSVKILFSDI